MKLRKKIFLSATALAACAATLTTTTYAWYVSNSEATVTGVSGATAGGESGNILLAQNIKGDTSAEDAALKVDHADSYTTELKQVTDSTADTVKLVPVSKDVENVAVKNTATEVASGTKYYTRTGTKAGQYVYSDATFTKVLADSDSDQAKYFTMDAAGVYTKLTTTANANDTYYVVNPVAMVHTAAGEGVTEKFSANSIEKGSFGELLKEVSLYTANADSTVYTPVKRSANYDDSTTYYYIAEVKNTTKDTFTADTDYYTFTTLGTPLDETTKTGWHDVDLQPVAEENAYAEFSYWLQSTGTSSVNVKFGIENVTNRFTYQQCLNTTSAPTDVKLNQSFYKDAVQALRVEILQDGVSLGVFEADKFMDTQYTATYAKVEGAAASGDANAYYAAIKGYTPLGGTSTSISTAPIQTIKVTAGVGTHLTFRYWLEGTDADCFDSCMGQSFNFSFKFSA